MESAGILMHAIAEYLTELGRQHAEELRALGAVAVFALVVIACRLARRS